MVVSIPKKFIKKLVKVKNSFMRNFEICIFFPRMLNENSRLQSRIGKLSKNVLRWWKLMSIISWDEVRPAMFQESQPWADFWQILTNWMRTKLKLQMILIRFKQRWQKNWLKKLNRLLISLFNTVRPRLNNMIVVAREKSSIAEIHAMQGY